MDGACVGPAKPAKCAKKVAKKCKKTGQQCVDGACVGPAKPAKCAKKVAKKCKKAGQQCVDGKCVGGATTPAPAPEPEPDGWRVLATTTNSGWAWDVKRVKFINENGVEVNNGQYTIVESGHQAGFNDRYVPQSAFVDDNAIWGGRQDNTHVFYIGLTGGMPHINSVKLTQNGPHSEHCASSVQVQHKVGDAWITVNTADNIACTGETEVLN